MKTTQVLLLLASLGMILCLATAKVRASIPDCNTTRDIDAELVNDIEKAGGNNDFVGLNSNQILTKLKNKDYANEISKEEAVAYTMKGITVIVGLEGIPKGQIAEVAPLEMVDSKSSWGMVPRIFYPGGKDGPIALFEKFSTSGPMPKFYVRKIDLLEPEVK